MQGVGFEASAIGFSFLLMADRAIRGVFAQPMVGTDQGRPLEAERTL